MLTARAIMGKGLSHAGIAQAFSGWQN